MSETRKLIQYGLYNRAQVCSILAPNISFTPQSGTWGLHGLIRINPSQSNFVLFVTLGARQAGYQFNETINSLGEFEWHSQPSLKLEDAVVKELVNHDSYRNSIFVFFRPTSSKKEYIFLGHAKYIRHNENKEMPVHIAWKIIDWNNEQFALALKTYVIGRKEEDDLLKTKEISIEQLKLSVRLYNCLKKASIHTLYDLINIEPTKLLRLRNMGAKSYAEALVMIESCSENGEMNFISHEEGNHFFDSLCLSVRAKHVLQDNGIETEIALAMLDKETIRNFKNSGSKTNTEIIYAINFLLESNLEVRATYLAIYIAKIHADYYELNVEDVFTMVIAEQLKSQNIILIKDLLNANIEKLMILRYQLQSFVSQLSILEKSLKEYTISELCELLKNKSKTGKVDNSFERNYKILLNRAADKTLEQCGAEFDLTRERVRQIETKFLARAKNFSNSNAVKLFLKSRFCSQSYMFREDFFSILNELSNLLFFTLVNNDVDYFHFIDDYDMIIVGDNWYEDISALFDSFPETISTEDINHYKYEIAIKFKELKIDVSEQVLERIFEIEYTKNGFLFSKKALNAVKKVVTILQTYFRNGINVYEESDLKKFRLLYVKMFDSEELSLNDRALTSRIINKCILVGRGIYALKEDKCISDELTEKINIFIQSQQRGIISINHIFLEFEKELSKHGINNRYHLLGVLKELFKNKYYTKRDYLTKTKEESSYYDEIYKYILKSDIPVTKEDLLIAFPGTTDIIITIATSNPDILNLFGSFLHISKVDIYDEEIAILRIEIVKLVKDNIAHHITELMQLTSNSLKHLYSRTGLLTKSKVYNLVYALFFEEFQFKRPFIALHGVEIPRSKDLLAEYIYSFDEIQIQEIQKFTKENKILVYSIIELLDSFNDTYLIKDGNSIALVDKIGIGEDALNKIKSIITQEMANNEVVIIREMQLANKLPKIKFAWNEWLLYSIVKKYIKEFSVCTSDGQFRHSVPIIHKNHLETNVVREIVTPIVKSLNKDKVYFFDELDVDKEFFDCFDTEECD